MQRMNFLARTGFLAFALAFACAGLNCPSDMDPGDGPGDGDGDDHAHATLFVVNNADGVTSYADAHDASGDVLATTDLPAGASTSIFQPRSVAVTSSGVLIVSRQNG